jgi:phosphonate transport system permease protein
MAEIIEALDLSPAVAVRSTGASWLQTLAWGVIPGFLPKWVESVLYVWELNIRDATVLGLVGAGGLGLLVAESTSLVQAGRLSTLLLAIVILVVTFNAISYRVRMALQ